LRMGRSWGRWMICVCPGGDILLLEWRRKLENWVWVLRDADGACFKNSGCPMLCESFEVSWGQSDHENEGSYLQLTGSNGGSQMSSPMEIHFANTR